MAEVTDSYSDIEEDVDNVTELFNRAAQHVTKLVPHLESAKLLELYSYYKQSTEGSCNIPKPGWYQMQAKAKWEAWNSLGNMNSKDAKEHYISLVAELDPEFDTSTETPAKTEGWVTVSCLARGDEALEKSNGTVLDFVKDGEMKKLALYIDSNPDFDVSNAKDEDGLGLIHWAADRGHVDILKYLIEQGIDVNMTDNDGQTALHYAAGCDHLDCVRLLVDLGADKGAKDTDGTFAADLASDTKVLELLSIS